MVLEGTSGKTYVGRWHEQTAKGVVMHDVATHDPAAGQTREDFIAQTLKFGVKPEQRTLVIGEELRSVKRLAEF